MKKYIFLLAFGQLFHFTALSKPIGNDTLKILKSLDSLAVLINEKPAIVEQKADSLQTICRKIGWKKGLAWSYYYAGAVQVFSYKNSKKAELFFKKAEESFSTDSDLKIQLLAGLSFAKNISGNYSEGLQKGLEALSISEKLNKKTDKGKIYNIIGGIYSSMDNVKMAAFYFEKALSESQSQKNEFQKLMVLNNLSIVYSKIKDVNKAHSYHKQAIEVIEKNKSAEKLYGAILYITHGYNFILKRQLDSAEIYVNKSIKLCKNNLDKNKYAYAYALTNLGYIQMCKHNFVESENNLKEALKLSIEQSDHYIRYRIYQILANLRFAEGNYREGLSYQESSFSLRDSITSKENIIKISELEAKYKTAEKERQLAESQLEIAQKRNWIIGLSIALASLIALGLAYWKNRETKQKAILQAIELEKQREILKVRELERQRIAKELHDSVGSQLTVVSTSLDNAFFLAENNQLFPQKLENINSEVRQAAQSLRDTIWATHNTTILVSQLYARMQHYLSKISENNSNLTANSERIGDDFELNAIQALNIFRIFQEAIQNIQKHAKASKITTSIGIDNQQFTLKVIDNGKGFAANKMVINENFGLFNMQNRSDEISAKLSIQSEENAGTAIILTLPL